MSAPKASSPSRADLMKKRRKALWHIVPVAALTGGASGTPTPGFEFPKQAAVSTADIALLAGIYNLYFEEDVSPRDMPELLKQAGILIAVGGGVVYSGIKLSEAGAAEVLNFLPGLGWVLSSLVTSSVTATVAALWWWYCDRHARNGTKPLASSSARTTSPHFSAVTDE
jgi:hypothetical protein